MEWIKGFEVLNLKKGDMIIIRPNIEISPNRMIRISRSLEAKAKEQGIKVLVLPREYDVSVGRPENEGLSDEHY